MSNGARAVRKLRSETALLLSASDASFAVQFAKLKGAARQSKVASALGAHQLAWRKEAMALARQRKQAEREATAAANIDIEATESRKPGATEADPDSFALAWREMQESRVQLQRETQAMARELHAAVHRAKALLKAGKQQKVLEKAEQRIQPTIHRQQQQQAATKKKSVGFAVGASAAELKADAKKPTPVAPASTPLGSFLANFLENAAITSQQLAAEEHNLVAQLLLMQNTLDRYEAPIEVEDDDATEKENPYIELAEHEEMEEEKQKESLLEPLSGGEDSLSSPPRRPTHQQTFLTADALMTRSPRTRRTHRGVSQALSPSSGFPPIPDLEPSLSALPDEEIQRARVEREDQWTTAGEQYRRSIDARLEDNLSQLKELFHLDTASLRQRVDRSDAAAAAQGWTWTQKHAARMASIQQSYKHQGATHAQLLDRLRLEFAHETKQLAGGPATAAAAATSGKDPLCLSDRLDWSEKQRIYRIQRQALLSAAEVDRAQFIARARSALLDWDRAFVTEYNRRCDVQATLEAQAGLHGELAVLREEKQARDAVEAKEAAIRAAQLEEERQARQAREAVVREQQRLLLSLYHAHLAAEEESQANAAARAKAAAAEEARAELEAARPSVQRRQVLLQERRQAQAEREAQARRDEEQREARLEAMRQLVAPTVERDADRARQATAASAADLVDGSNNPLFAVHGYDMSSLLKDKRFKLQLALWTAGVSDSAYARQMVMGAAPAQAPRPDMHSSVFPARPT